MLDIDSAKFPKFQFPSQEIDLLSERRGWTELHTVPAAALEAEG